MFAFGLRSQIVICHFYRQNVYSVMKLSLICGNTVHMNENIEVAVVSVRAAEGGTSTIIPFLTPGHAFISLIGLLEKNGMDTAKRQGPLCQKFLLFHTLLLQKLEEICRIYLNAAWQG